MNFVLFDYGKVGRNSTTSLKNQFLVVVCLFDYSNLATLFGMRHAGERPKNGLHELLVSLAFKLAFSLSIKCFESS
jgi:hypothetical protein